MPIGINKASRNSQIGSAIPDSALLQFPFNERTDSTLVETQEGANGVANGITNVSGTWYEGYAESGNGSSDYGDLGDWSGVNFGADLDSNWCLLFTIETTDNDMVILGSRGDTGGGSTTLQVEMGRGSETDGGIAFFIADSADNRIQASTDSGAFNDGSKHRVAINKTGNTVNDVEIWVNGSDEPTTALNSDTIGSSNNFANFVASHARNNGGSVSDYADMIIDNIIPCGTDLTGSEIQTDYDQQPWS